MTIEQKLDWLKILNEGVNKPDLSKGERSTTGTVRETKNLMPYIIALNDSLCKDADIYHEKEKISEQLETEENKIHRNELGSR